MKKFNDSPSQQRNIFSISELNAAARKLLESNFPSIWVSGEISNLATPSSGHIYFSLKDNNAQVRCAMFKYSNSRLIFNPENGLQVLAKAKLSLYEGRGDFQLIIEHMELSGDGALRRAFEILKNKLEKEGLFAVSNKKTLPRFPTTIAAITSPSGAAVRDIIATLNRRYPIAKLIIYPTEVQGGKAAVKIIQALTLANDRKEVDVIILARGGGSLEDLWAFNDEMLARTISQSQLPIITGIGHEIDFTIADLVADIRAPTPTAAAETIVPDKLELLALLSQFDLRITRCIRQYLNHKTQLLQQLRKGLRHPSFHLRERAQLLDQLEQKLLFNQQLLLQKKSQQLQQMINTLFQTLPFEIIKRQQSQLDLNYQSLQYAFQQLINSKKSTLNQLLKQLEILSPLTTLQRGYSIALTADNKTITNASQTETGDLIHLKLYQGQLTCKVTDKT